MVPNPVEVETTAFVASLQAADPDAPTLCGEWTVRQLLGHLVLRERSLTEVLGRVPSRRLHAIAQRHIDHYVAEHSYADLIETFAAGAPRYSPFAVPALRNSVNLLEYTVHHEDVRRAGADWQPRALSTEQQAAVWGRVRLPARLTMRSLRFGVRLTAPGLGSITVGRGTPHLTVTGDPVEIALLAFGRQQAARVDYQGVEDEIALVRNATFSL